MDLSNACYYTFSTISQTLAGAFGILVAVTLYRMEAVNSLLRSGVRKIDRYFRDMPSPRAMETAIDESDFAKIADALKGFVPPSDWTKERKN